MARIREDAAEVRRVHSGERGPVTGGAGPPLHLSTRRPRPKVCVVSAEGELDMATAPVLRDHLRRDTADRPAFLVLDLTAVTFLAAAGIAVVVTALRNDDGIHGHLLVVAPPGSTALRALRLTDVHALLPVHPDVEAALAAVPNA